MILISLIINVDLVKLIITKKIQSTLHIVSTLYSEHLHIVNNFGETLQRRFIGIVSLYSEQNTAANCVHYMES